MKKSGENQQTPNFRRRRPSPVVNENVSPNIISEFSTNQEMTELEMDKSIGGVSQGQQSKKSNKSGNLRNKKKPLAGENSATIRMQDGLMPPPPKSPDVFAERKLGQMGMKKMQTTISNMAKPKLGQSSNFERQTDDLRSQASRKSANTYQRSQNFKLAEGSDAGELKIENDRLQTTIMILNQKLKTQNDSDAQINGLKKKLKESEEMQQKCTKDNLTLKNQNLQLKSENSFLQSQIDSLESTVSTLNSSIREKEDDLDKTEEIRADLKQDIEELNSNLQSQEEELYNVKRELHDTHNELEETSQELQETSQELERTSQELQEANIKVKENESLNERYQMAQEKIHKLMVDVEQLMKGTQAICIGHKMDKIDNHLANYINQYPERDRIKVLFLRESEGVYQFGQKRVYVKIEKGNQIQVRVGGGFMHIDDFIELYTPLEVEKIERRDVMSRFQSKLQAQKISQEMSTNAYETSPIGLPQRPSSPNVRGKTSPSRKSPVRRSIAQFSPVKGSPKSPNSPNKKRSPRLVKT